MIRHKMHRGVEISSLSFYYYGFHQHLHGMSEAVLIILYVLFFWAKCLPFCFIILYVYRLISTNKNSKTLPLAKQMDRRGRFQFMFFPSPAIGFTSTIQKVSLRLWHLRIHPFGLNHIGFNLSATDDMLCR